MSTDKYLESKNAKPGKIQSTGRYVTKTLSPYKVYRPVIRVKDDPDTRGVTQT